MNTEELVRKLRKNKRVRVYLSKTLSGVRLINVCNDSGGRVLGIRAAATNWLECEYYRPQAMADSFAGIDREYISSLISQYLNTPISKREPEKKYTVLAIRGTDDNYLVLDPSYEPSFGPLSLHKDYDYQVSFTKKQIDRMKELGTIAIDWDKAVIKEAKGDAY